MEWHAIVTKCWQLVSHIDRLHKHFSNALLKRSHACVGLSCVLMT